MRIQIRIKEVAQSKGIRTAYQLKKLADLSPTSASRLFKNQVSHFNIVTLEKLCIALDCQPGDIIVKTEK